MWNGGRKIDPFQEPFFSLSRSTFHIHLLKFDLKKEKIFWEWRKEPRNEYQRIWSNLPNITDLKVCSELLSALEDDSRGRLARVWHCSWIILRVWLVWSNFQDSTFFVVSHAGLNILDYVSKHPAKRRGISRYSLQIPHFKLCDYKVLV